MFTTKVLLAVFLASSPFAGDDTRSTLERGVQGTEPVVNPENAIDLIACDGGNAASNHAVQEAVGRTTPDLVPLPVSADDLDLLAIC